MKIAVFTDSYYPHTSGVTTTVDQQARKLAERGHKIKIFCPKPKKNNRQNLELPKNIEVTRLPANISVLGYSTLPLSIPTVTKSLKEVKNFRPDIVHIHTEGGVGWEGLICAKVRKIPIVTTLHTFLAHQEYLKNWKLDKLENFKKIGWKYVLMIHNQAKIVICPSKAMKEEALKNGLEVETKVIANGIDLEKYDVGNADLRSLQSGNFEFIYVGRIAVEKSLPVLIKAFKIIHQKHPQTKLTIIGDGPALSDLRKMAADLNLAGKIIFTGRIPYQQLIASDLISSADVFVTPSKTENQPLSVMEAMAFGLPIIGVDALGMSELVDHQQNGFLAEPDNVRQIVEYANQIIVNPGLVKKMGQASQQKIKQFSLSKTVEKLEKTYEKTAQKT